jgi:hypothetical protein
MGGGGDNSLLEELYGFRNKTPPPQVDTHRPVSKQSGGPETALKNHSIMLFGNLSITQTAFAKNRG